MCRIVLSFVDWCRKVAEMSAAIGLGEIVGDDWESAGDSGVFPREKVEGKLIGNILRGPTRLTSLWRPGRLRLIANHER